jgi:uncharacterized membrane protein
MFLGLIGFMLVFVAAGNLMPRESSNQNLYGFIHVALAGFWVSVAAPWIFVKLRLAGSELS